MITALEQQNKVSFTAPQVLLKRADTNRRIEMGKGYSILIWDNWGCGLVKVNARLLEKGKDIYGNPCNWWSNDDNLPNEQIASKHELWEYEHWQIIHD